MNKLKFISLYLLLAIASIHSYGQSYFANGNAKSIGGSCYQLTDATDWQLGSVWYAEKLNLSQDFDLEFELNFGSNNGGADGIVFVMQTVGNRALGNQGGGIGFEGFSPSLGIEFDDWQNNSMGDIAADHIAILKNGSVNHTSNNSISPPVSALVGAGNIEDGTNHLVRITWVASTKKLEVWFDCILRQSITLDIINSIFSGQNQVFWGFTSATGGANNKQIACLRDNILVPDTFAICKGEEAALNARESYDGTYKWTPNLYLNDNTVQNPMCSSVIPFTYEVEFKDRCNNTIIDTIEVTIDQPFVMDEGEDTLLCDGAGYSFDLRSEYDSVLWHNGSRTKLSFWDQEGFYKLRAWKGVCYDDDSFNITTNVSPEIVFDGDQLFCEGDSTLISIGVTPQDALYHWSDGSTSVSQYFSSTDQLSVSATNECNTVFKSYDIREIIIDKFSLGNDSIICIGDTTTLGVSLAGSFDYLWSNGANVPSIKVTQGGSYWIEVSEEDLCFASDTILLTEVQKPALGSLGDVLLCINEEIILTVENEHGTVLWNNKVSGETYTLKNVEGELPVVSTNECGMDSISVEIELKDCYCNMIFPNAFTPNYDQINQSFHPIVDCPKLTYYKLLVFNRWGEQVFMTADVNEGWDGFFKNSQAQSGVYFWVAEWNGVENGFVTNKTDKGVLHLIR